MDRNIYTGLYTAYLKMYHEAAIGKVGTHDSDVTVGRTQGKTEGGGWTGTPQTGLGRNYKGDKDKVAKRYKDVKRQDKANDRGISSSDRRARAAKNKENTAKAGIDSLLKDIRGK